jgi:hypothetical protein
MLLFDLEHDQTTIKIKGREYDKNTLLTTFEELKEAAPFHLILYKNQPLLGFLENGEVDFFTIPKSWEDLDDLVFMVWIESSFTERYREEMYKCSTAKGFQSLNKLKIICQSEFELPFTFQDACHEKTYSYFYNLIAEGKRKFKNPVKIISRKKRTVLKGTEAYLSIHYFSALKILPASFNNLKEQYGYFAHSILYAALYKGKFMQYFDKDSLKTLKLCAQISAELIQNKSAKNIQKDIQKVIEAKEMSNLEALSIGLMIYLIIFLTLFVLKYL